jgi:CelD/BcsL family acetyltransferase involved in cellulose biosynthesis
MQLYTLDPLLDSRWEDLVAAHPGASVFHRTGWLQALARTYRYRPFVVTTTPPGRPLEDGLPFCEVKSWVTGNRLVSLPFADHAGPLLREAGEPFQLDDWMQAQCREHKWRYIELRPLPSAALSAGLLAASQSFWHHTLDLSPSVEQIFRRFHKSCVQRRIRHAEHQRLSYERGCFSQILDDFYRLLAITRRRHRLLPQPRSWFLNLTACLASSAEIRLVRQDGSPIAAILTGRHRSTVVYKYGCSDERFHSIGGMPFLFWKMIEESRSEGAEQIDFGRTDVDNHGLTEFKDRLGAARRRLVYFRYPSTSKGRSLLSSYTSAPRVLFSALPSALSSTVGRMVYRHIA